MNSFKPKAKLKIGYTLRNKESGVLFIPLHCIFKNLVLNDLYLVTCCRKSY